MTDYTIVTHRSRMTGAWDIHVLVRAGRARKRTDW